MNTAQPFDEMFRRLKEKNFDLTDFMNIVLRVVPDERAAALLRYMDKHPDADADDLMDEACRLQKLYPSPRRMNKPEHPEPPQEKPE